MAGAEDAAAALDCPSPEAEALSEGGVGNVTHRSCRRPPRMDLLSALSLDSIASLAPGILDS